MRLRIEIFILAVTLIYMVTTPAAAELVAGAGRASITPDLRELPTPLGGYGARGGAPASGVHDDVHARALVLRSGDSKPVALVSLELCFATERLEQEILARLPEGMFDEATLFLSATHSHTSPDPMCMNVRNPVRLRQVGIYDQRLVDFTAQRTADAIMQAFDSLAPAQLTVAQRQVDLNMNRRREEQTDQEMIVLELRRPDSPRAIAVVVNYAAHPTIYSAAMMQISGDWPGEVSRRVEAAMGGESVCIVVNGALGDAAPKGSYVDPPAKRVEQYGGAVAEVVQSMRQAAEMIDRPIAVRAWSQPVNAPPRTLPQAAVQTWGLPKPLLEYLLNQLMPPVVTMSYLELGPVTFIGFPGEPSTPIGLEAKGIAREKGVTIPAIAAPVGDWVGYILTPQQYSAGGYEASASFYGLSLAEALLEQIRADENLGQKSH